MEGEMVSPSILTGRSTPPRGSPVDHDKQTVDSFSPGVVMTTEFHPKIIAFACNWCSYAGADLAGVSRMQYPPSIRLIRLMCSGMMVPAYVLKAFEGGADGVLVTG
jgi:F420-non-reducing hydrogenase iron-sulfur subunit